MRPRLALPVLVLAAGVAGLVALAPSLGTGAFLTSTVTGSASAAGTAQWCAAPDPSAASSGNRVIRLSTVTAATGSSGHIAIIPVANDAAWGGGTGSPALSVRLWGCQDGTVTPVPAQLADTLRITSWSNPGSGAGTRSWLAGSETVAPTARLDPSTGLGAQLTALAQGGSATASQLLVGGSGSLLQYSWIVSSGRAASAPSADPTACTRVLGGALGSCTIALTNGTGGDAAFSAAFNVNPWATATIQPVSYPARTFTTQSSTGWATGSSYLTESCSAIVLLCTAVAAPVTMTATSASASTLLSSTNGNLLQWLVIQWNGTTTPSADVEVEVVLS